METIRDRYLRVIENVNNACIRVNRPYEQVKLIVVVKRQPIFRIIEVLEAGAIRLGENYPEVIPERKQSLIDYPEAEWHMIGHIQSRKIKYLEHFSLIHSIDSIEVMNRISNSLGSSASGLLEINVSQETTKYGFDLGADPSIESYSRSLADLIQSSQVHILGLMCMPPMVVDAELNRVHFRKCKEILMKIQELTRRTDFRELSMGTSHDYEVAIEEGATFIRVGESIMGPRYTD